MPTGSARGHLLGTTLLKLIYNTLRSDIIIASFHCIPNVLSSISLLVSPKHLHLSFSHLGPELTCPIAEVKVRRLGIDKLVMKANPTRGISCCGFEFLLIALIVLGFAITYNSTERN